MTNLLESLQFLRRNPVAVHLHAQAERHFDPCDGALFDVFGFHDGHFRELLIVHVANERQVAFVAGLLGRNVNVLLDGDGWAERERGVFSGLHFHADDGVEARADGPGDGRRAVLRGIPGIEGLVITDVEIGHLIFERGARHVAAGADDGLFPGVAGLG